MSQQHRREYASFLGYLLIAVIVVTGLGCDSILPEDFQDKDYTIATVDNQACTLLKDTTGTVLVPGILSSFVDSAALVNNTENQNILANFSALTAGLPQLAQESLVLVDQMNQKVAYAVLNVSAGQAKDLCIYTSLKYDAGNINDFITIQVLRSDTTVVASDITMLGETVSGGMQTVIVNDVERFIPTIRSRDKVHLEQGVYLVRLTMSSPATTGIYKIIILPS